MARVLAVTNQKGGVGKTTTSINLAAALVKARQRVLLIDLDPQCNATVGSGVDKSSLDRSIYDVLLSDDLLADTTVSTESGYKLVPAAQDLAGATIELAQAYGRERRLLDALIPVFDSVDYVLIDCPPALDLLTVNALVAAQAVIIPIQCEYYALEGLTALLDTIAKVRQSLNPKIEIEGLLRTMFDGRNSLANEVSDQLKAHFGDKVFRTMVPRNIRLAEAPSYGKPVIDYDPSCVGSQAYLALAGELLQKSRTTVSTTQYDDVSTTMPGTSVQES